MQQPTWQQQLRYRFDNLMARGISGQMLMLGLLSAILIVASALLLLVTGLAPEGEDGSRPGLPMLVWMALMRSMDAGAVGGDSGSWPYLFVMLGVTFGGIFVLSTLIGVLNSAIEEILEDLRKGKSLVVEKGHTIVLGYPPKIHMILAELSIANQNKPNACVAVLAERDKVEMDDEIGSELGERKLRVVTRSGSPYSMLDLEIVNPSAARAVVLLSPEGELPPSEADIAVLKALLAVSKLPAAKDGRLHVVAELKEERTCEVARMVAGPSAALVVSPPLISRLLVQTGRQSGLSAVYTELLSFEGNEIYVMPAEGLAGKTFREALLAYDDSALIGLFDAKDEMMLPPPMDRPFAAGDRIVVISEDDNTIHRNGVPGPLDPSIVVPARPRERLVERTLVLGASPRLSMVLKELDSYVASGSETLVIGESFPEPLPALSQMTAQAREGDVTDRRVLDSLSLGTFDHILVLSETIGRDQDLADARTTVTLLHLRDIARRTGVNVPITSEMLDLRNQELASVAEADDFIISNTLIALVLAQLSESPSLVRVFDELFSPRGYEIYLKPMSEYAKLGSEVDFYALVQIAAERNEIAIGYRKARLSRDSSARYGVRINPRKRDRILLEEGDKIVVLAAD